MSFRILVVEDEESIAEVLSEALRRQGYRVLWARDGDEALDKALSALPDLIILDVMLPKMDGWEVCRRIREDRNGKEIPVIMLTARRDERDAVAGLEAGADDYVRKPFSIPELMARVRSRLKRHQSAEASSSRVSIMGDLSVEEGGETLVRGEPLDLSPTEQRLLEVLIKGQGRLVTKEEVLAKVWGHLGGDSRTVDVHVFRLRKKLSEARAGVTVRTVRGRGYRMTEG
ncbi:response regulator with CheY-like receiver domain and winged-helix DNA-binding domain [Thermanaerovibrio velox DSM 12556]|uniref:Response regulator with CheY-like receiver domain and winged-helix DNA-binding domain n=1 Tax=Thermanaerovibrio velox DSM 12556 TaxID=926567 RepID=H0UMZ7_9BACT|nr:response regulator transcription factor [Thermanaerovibrio velox]EHM09276.1 response regulator with CheY-like receiver domain and winged-helix DNA-binding domain [Thermanaerovibrio velox DSM 12556]